MQKLAIDLAQAAESGHRLEGNAMVGHHMEMIDQVHLQLKKMLRKTRHPNTALELPTIPSLGLASHPHIPPSPYIHHHQA